MHAVFLLAAIAVAALVSLVALWVADRAPAWGDRRALHAFALVVPPLCAILLGATLLKMLVISCTRFGPLDAILSVILVGTLAASVASSIMAHIRRLSHVSRLRQQLDRLQAEEADRRASAALERALARIAMANVPRLQVVDSERPLAFIAGIFTPTVVVSTALLDVLDPAELEATLLHELAHLKNGDNLFSAIFGWIRHAFSFLPAAQWAWARYEADRECIADDLAARVTGRPEVLAEALVKIGEASLPGQAVAVPPRPPIAAVASMETRVGNLLALEGTPYPRALTSLTGGAFIVLLLAAGALSAPLLSEGICMRVFCSR
ncbi:MAG: M56 family metallopeptidase [Cyanobacteria bacterium REEB65]|nr:M56 family metallopeptidase [Cyanobacteria bacterium REEB65]